MADRKSHAERIESLDGIPVKKIAGQYVVGIEREAKILRAKLENYVKKIVSVFQSTNVTEPLKTQILSSFDSITLYGLTFIRITVPRQNDVSFVDDKAFYREGSNTVQIEGQKLLAVSKLFGR